MAFGIARVAAIAEQNVRKSRRDTPRCVRASLMLPDVLGIHPSFFYFSGKRTILRFSASLLSSQKLNFALYAKSSEFANKAL
jgi:hypothetical protein